MGIDPEDLIGERAKRLEGELTDRKYQEELRRIHRLGLPPADSIQDKELASTFQRGEIPHFSGIKTFLKAPYLEDVTLVGEHEVAVVGVPLDTGTTYRPGPRFGPEGMRSISSLYSPYYYEHGVDLREQLDIVDVGDIFITPANIEKAFDQITKGIEHIVSHGVFPVILGGDHSIGFPTARGVMNAFGRKIGVIHFDRHLDTQKRDLDERMHTTPWYWAAHELHFDMGNLVQIGIGGWQVPRPGVLEAREGGSVVITVEDLEEHGLDAVADLALEVAWSNGAQGVFLSFDIDAIDPGFAPGTGWPEPGGLYPREALKLVRRFAAEGLLGMEVVEVSPPYDSSDVTSLLGVRLICDVLAASVKAGKLGRTRSGAPQTPRAREIDDRTGEGDGG
ncbi:agmatinase [Sphaerisporangium krabiense]|uniref:Agmatinase n=1 Tax=Sphaerisporangium krabiense TaxID=763782 RepID=A0A7W8Z1W0_9ACTN|nr:agmatinase family protein [Sphaerisporangium krabiense]MBB5625871.1 agmatinase [Sphaerisporangium krabiense]GII64673.1 agmatinase [Sphaerisporangium krabiense]